jgi:hypothetical protein
MLLPYLEQGNAYRQYRAKSLRLASDGRTWNLHSSNLRLRVFESPADPTLGGVVGSAHSVCSYPASAVVFVPNMRLEASIPDGASNTLSHAEHYAWECGGIWFAWTESNFMIGTAIWPPTFADRAVGAPVPSKPGEVPPVTFQVRPAVADCDPRLPQTPHEGGMLVGYLDGSVRTMRAGVSPAAYWAAVTPAGGETIAPD